MVKNVYVQIVTFVFPAGGGDILLGGIYSISTSFRDGYLLQQDLEFELEDVLLPSVTLLALLEENLFGVGQNQAARLHHPAWYDRRYPCLYIMLK